VAVAPSAIADTPPADDHGGAPDGGHMVDLQGTITAARAGVRIDTDCVVRADGVRLGFIASMIHDGLLQLEIQQTVPFERAPQALDRVLAKHVRGKIALQIIQGA
jgi:NADPH:quinone reductase-like Zn-dependent oxidoreductase